MKKFIVMAIAAMIALPSATMAQKTTIQRVTREKTYTTQTHKVSVWYEGDFSVGFAAGGKATISEDGYSETLKTNLSRPYIETVHGVHITKYAFVGLGVGVQYAYGKINTEYDDSNNWNTLLMPVFLNLKGFYPASDDFAPYITTSLGASPVLMADDTFDSALKGGFFCKVGAGISYRKFLFDFGLMHQNMTLDKDEKIGNNSFYVNVGFKF